MNCASPVPSPIAALASSRPGRLPGVELSIVSILDGEIGDPVTWIDEPDGVSWLDRAPALKAEPFQAVVDDIGAHLPTGTVFVHGTGPVFALLRPILPGWRPALVVDTLSLAEYAKVSTQRYGGTSQLAADPNAADGLGATAGRAVATAQLSLRLIGQNRPHCALEQEEYTRRFL
jgi:hypothetical protein